MQITKKKVFTIAGLILLNLQTVFSSTNIRGLDYNINTIDGISNSSNYSFTQNDTVVSISGKQSNASDSAIYFFNHVSNGDESQFIALINPQTLVGLNSKVGIMMNFNDSNCSGCPDKWCRLSISEASDSLGRRTVIFEQKHSSDSLIISPMAAIMPSAGSVFMKVIISNGVASFYLSSPQTLPADTVWIQLGVSVAIPLHHSFGVFIEPHNGVDFENATFGLSVLRRTPSNGLAKLAGYKTIGTGNLTDWAGMAAVAASAGGPLTTSIPLPFLTDIKNSYIGGNFTDQFQSNLFLKVQNIVQTVPLTELQSDGSDSLNLETSIQNLQLLLADRINSHITGQQLKFSTVGSNNLFLTFRLNSIKNSLLQVYNVCNNAFHHQLWTLLIPVYNCVVLYDYNDCYSTATEWYGSNKSTIDGVLNNKDLLLEDGAYYLLQLTLLSMLDKNFYIQFKNEISDYANQMRDYVEKIGPIYNNYNNIPLKAFSAIALWDLLNGSTTGAARLNLSLKEKLRDDGVYAEGNYYLNWLNRELLPYSYFATYCGLLPNNLQLPGMKNSGYWLLGQADTTGYIAPAKDGINGANMWLAPYSYLCGDNTFKEYQSRTSLNGYYDPVFNFLTYPSRNYSAGDWNENKVVISGGIGKLNAIMDDGSAVSATVITEDPVMRKKGGSHDQQDDGNITLRRASTDSLQKKAWDQLLIDPGYGGYENKGKDGCELYTNHNTVQINNYPAGGVDSCAWETYGDYMNKIDSSLDIDLQTFYNNVVSRVGEAATFILPGFGISSAVDIANMNYGLPTMVLNPADRISGGPGYSEMIKTYPNGFVSKITFNSNPNRTIDANPDFAYRTVLQAGNEMFVIDQISSNQNSYSLNYNLPLNSNGSNNIYIGDSGSSKLRLSVFSGDDIQSTASEKDYWINEKTANSNGTVFNKVKSVRFTNSGTNLPGAGQYFSFITMLEPADKSVSYGQAYQKVTGDIGSAQILVCKTIDANTLRYVFVNTITNGSGGIVKIPARSGWNAQLTTDAHYGVIDFDKRTYNFIPGSTFLYAGTTSTYNGGVNNVPLVGSTIVPSSIQTKIYHGAPSDTGSASFDPSAKKIVLTAKDYNGSETYTGGYTYGYWNIEGDFEITFNLQKENTGFMVRTSLTDVTQPCLWEYLVYRPDCLPCGKPICKCGGLPSRDCYIKDNNSTTWISNRAFGMDDFTTKCKRTGNKIVFYMLKMGSTEWDSIGQLTVNTSNLYIGYTFLRSAWYLDSSATFDTISTSQVSSISSSADKIINATTLSALGYTTGGKPVSDFALNSQDGYIFSHSLPDSTKLTSITTPAFSADRNKNGGISFEWKAKYPTWYYDSNFSAANSFTVDFLTANNSKYSLNFTPRAEASGYSGDDFKLFRNNDSALIYQSNSGKVTPLGDSAPWIKFRIEMYPTDSNGTGFSKGEIVIYYDNGDGAGYVPVITANDTSYSTFTGITFNYQTNTGLNHYQIYFKDIVVNSINGQSQLPSIYLQPADTLVGSGDTAIFSIGAVGGAISYQWCVNGQIINGATSDTFIIPDVSISDSGSIIRCIVSNADGGVVSRAALLKVYNKVHLSVQMKDNGFSENDITKPQLYIKNNGTTAISGFKVRLWFSRQEYPGRQITVDNYYMNPSGITISQGIHSQNANVFYVDLQYPASYSLAAGDSTPVDGVQFGVHFQNYYPGEWIKTNDWSWQGMSASFSTTQYVTVYGSNNKLIYGKEPDISQIPPPEVISMEDVFGFENIDAWKTLQGTSNLSSSPKTQGLSSLEISGGGYQEIVSANLITSSISGSTAHLSFDLNIGSNQPNQYWIGQVQLYANCPSAGIYNAYIGQQDLTGKPIGSFSTITMDLPSSVSAAFNGNFSDFSFKIVLNTNSGSGPYWLDNMRFVNNSPSSNIYEAENATQSGGAKTNTNHTGYSGAGFVDGFYNSSTAQVSFAVNEGSAGSYVVKLHYSAGNGTSTNTGLYVNGTKIKNITFAATANWDTWADESETVALSAGNNTISYKAETASPSCINFDYISINGVGDPCTGVQGGENGLRGTTFGLTPPWSTGSEYCKATDGDTNTFYDYSQANGGYTGLDLGATKVITKIRYYPRANFANRMVGGKFQGSNTSSSSGFVDLYTITSTPTQAWNEVTISNSTGYRWVRYLAPDGGYGNIAEMEFYESSVFPDPNEWYKIATKANPNQCLDVTAGNYANGDTIELWPKINVNQEFKFKDAGNGYYTITCRADTGYSIDMSGNFAIGQKLKLWYTQTYNANQKFKPVALPGGYFRLESSNSGYSIDNTGSVSNGVKPWLWTSDDNNDNQKWVVTEVQ